MGVQDFAPRRRRSKSSPPQDAPKTHFFLIIFSMRFPIHFGSLLARFSIPTCLSKPIKIYPKSMLRATSSWASILINFWSVDAKFDPQNLKTQWDFNCFSIVFWKSPFRCWHRFLIRIRSWCQHAPISLPNINQTCIKIATWKASIVWSIFASMFYRFLLELGSRLSAMLVIFSSTIGWVIRRVAPSLLGLCSFLFFWPSRHPSREKCRAPLSIWEDFGIDFGRFWASFWRLLVNIW